MTLEQRLKQIAQMTPFDSEAKVTADHSLIVHQEGADADLVADYLQYKYSMKDHTPLGFMLWYVDIHKPDVDPQVYHHRSQENKLRKFQHGCHPAPDKIHEFP